MHHVGTPNIAKFEMISTKISVHRIVDNLAFDDLAAIVVLVITLALWYKNTLSKPPNGYHLYFISPQREDGLDRQMIATEKAPSRNINDRMNELKKDIVVFWGSQSGKSERLAKELARECSTRFGLAAMAADAEQFDFDQLRNLTKGRIVGFVVATYGEGDPTDNALGLHDYLREINRYSEQTFAHLQYFCFGLGSSQYQSYNRFVDFVDERLSSAGATRIVPVGKLDETLHSNDEWLAWKEPLIRTLAQKYNKKEQILSCQILRPTVLISEFSSKETGDRVESHTAEEGSTKRKANQRPQIVQITNTYRLSHSKRSEATVATREYLHVEVSTKTATGSLKYKTGDHLAIWPMNPNYEVDQMVNLFGWNTETLNKAISLNITKEPHDTDAKVPIKTPTTRLAILRYQLDICGQLFPELVKLLIRYCPTSEGKTFLENMLGEKESWDAIIKQHVTCAKLMQLAAPKERWPEDLFCEFVQVLLKLRPRYFSIASSHMVKPETIALTVSVVEAQLSQNHKFIGLTTGYLRALCDETEIDNIYESACSEVSTVARPHYNLAGPRSILTGRKIFAHVRPSPFHLPDLSTLPIIMFAAGSGIAPFRAFVQERLNLKKMGKAIGPMTLFFGCRSRDDLLYGKLWEEATSLGLLKTHFAFSTHLLDGQKVYIQDLLMQGNGSGVEDLISKQQGIVYICGSSNMARGVKEALDKILNGESSATQLKERGRLHEDVWVS
ncbi:hypothetical protein N7456_000927 [Penicillium angulare]|uniref:NADPH--cytochrome P450 reductase n=1 Tax=Penicillium angulare TaxID=116970 RepID=A0A9W9GCZ0_9EURO|nr:hypothetical protein N7456_000927 [Penicillium angulare]